MRGGNLAGLTIATACGILTAYTTLQPALQEEAEKKSGVSEARQEGKVNQDNVLSDAIKSDFQEARRQVDEYDRGRFAWGIRNWLFGPPQTPVAGQKSAEPAQQPASSKSDKEISQDGR